MRRPVRDFLWSSVQRLNVCADVCSALKCTCGRFSNHTKFLQEVKQKLNKQKFCTRYLFISKHHKQAQCTYIPNYTRNKARGLFLRHEAAFHYRLHFPKIVFLTTLDWIIFIYAAGWRLQFVVFKQHNACEYLPLKASLVRYCGGQWRKFIYK